LRQTRIIQPNYADHFRCTGSACEDTCCSGWRVSIDDEDYRKLTSVPPGPLRSLIDVAILSNRSGAEHPDGAGAAIQMLPAGECPLLSPEKLCRVQLEFGASHMARICIDYPRNSYCIDGLSETELSLSCPEAARLILLSPNLLPGDAAPGHQLTWDEEAATGTDLRPYFWQIRELVVRLILNRNYPIWQRLFLVGTFCRRLEAFGRGEIKRHFCDLLDDFSRAVSSPGLGKSMNAIAPDLPLQLQVVLSLVAERVNGAGINPRAHRVMEIFAKGLRHTRTASMESQVSRYAEAYQTHFAPFARRHPQVLENLLVNAVFRDAFPFGEALTPAGGDPEPVKAFARMAIQFALIKGLLIGVSGARRSRFGTRDVVEVVQIASRLFEHNPRFLQSAYNTLESNGLADARGLTILLRN
jgi:lysine-N-methylase